MVRLLEHHGKNLLSSVSVRVPKGEIANTQQQAKQIAERLGKPVAVKAQIPATGRFKAGGIAFATTPDEVANVAERMLRSEVKGFPVANILIEEKLDIAKEYYAGIIVDDSYKVRAPVLIFSTRGGVDIEQVASENPEELGKTVVDVLEGLLPSDVERLVRSLGVSSNLVKRFSSVVFGMYEVFAQYGARSVEVNPIALTSDGMVYVADCRIVLDLSLIHI